MKRHSAPSPSVRCSALAGNAFGADKVCKVEIAGNDAMQFDKKEIAVAADCTQVEAHAASTPASCRRRPWATTGC